MRCPLLRTFLFVCLIGGLLACDKRQKKKKRFVYLGPVMTVNNLNISYSDSGRVLVKMSTAKQLKMQNQDEVYPKPVYINFINKDGVEYSSLRADSGEYIKKENYYKVMGNVFFYNREAQQSLSTNELIWDPNRRIVHTDKKVQVNTPSDQIVGNGMEASQDFSKYKFTGSITGFFEVDSLITQPDSNSRALQP